jgi:hypothetical protein
MKNSRKTANKSVIVTLLLLVGLFVGSCDKALKEARQDIAGTWNIQRATIDGAEPFDSITGAWVFDECSRKENKSGCDVTLTSTVTFDGESSTETAQSKFKVLEGGDRIFFSDTEADLDIEGDNMTLTFDDSGEVTVYYLVR